MPKTELKEWFREHLIDWVNRRRNGVVFNNLDAASISKEMTRFYVTEIMSATNPGVLPDDADTIDEYLVDGADDGGVDFIYANEGQVLIIQSKYHQRKGTSEGPEQFSHFCDVLQRLREASKGRYRVNRKLRELLNDIDWESDNFVLHFCTLGQVNEPMRTKEAQGVDAVPGLADIDTRSTLTLLSETDLNEALREKINWERGGQNLTVDLKLVGEGDDPSWLCFDSADREMYVGVTSGSELCELFRPMKHRLNLFALNIRDYVGETSTNKQIIDTAADSPEDFLFYNNGISAVAAQVKPDDHDSNLLHCEQFSIINGAQTVKCLTKAKRKNNDAVRDVKVLIRIVKYRAAKDGDFLSNVTRYNNTQNAIKVSDFRSNDVVQRSIRTQFSQLSVGSKQCLYRNKRSKERDANKFIITMESFAKTVHAFLYGPDDMWGGTRKLFNTDPREEGRYCEVFGDANAPIAPDQFRFLAGIYFMCWEIEQMWRYKRESEDESTNRLPAIERKNLLFFAFGEYLRLAYGSDHDQLVADLRWAANPNKSMAIGKELGVRPALNDIYKWLERSLIRSYDKAKSEMADTFVHRNWFRSKRTLHEIHRQLEQIVQDREDLGLPRLRAVKRQSA